MKIERYLSAWDEKGNIGFDSPGKPSLECMCQNVLCGRTDPSLPFFTEGGSFWTNSTLQFLASTSENDLNDRTKNFFNNEGYESTALIPLRSGEEVIGLLQMNDRRPNQFSIDRIKFLEGIGASIGIALARKQMEEALKESEEKYRGIFDNAVEGIFQTTLEGRFISVNSAMARIYGFASPEELKMNIYDTATQIFINSEDRLRYRRLLVEQGTVTAFETQMNRKDGEKIWVSISAKAVKDKEGKIVCFEGITEDITQRKQAEEKIQDLARFPSENPNPILRINRDGTLLYINRAGLSLLPEWHLQVGQSVPPMLKDVISEVMNSGSTLLIDLEHGKRIYSFVGTPIANAGYINFYGRDITQRKQAEEALKKSLAQLQKANDGIIEAIVMAVEIRDPYTAGHQKRVATLARAIAQELGLTEEQVEAIRIAGAIHDLGKISIPADILSKPTKLTEIEFSLIKTHSEAGYRLLKDIEFEFPLAQIVLQHHERLDGTGYPEGIKDQEILLEAKIIAVADVVEAMATFRPYRPALGIDQALEEISKNKGRLYDPQAVDACLRLFKEKGFTFK